MATEFQGGPAAGSIRPFKWHVLAIEETVGILSMEVQFATQVKKLRVVSYLRIASPLSVVL